MRRALTALSALLTLAAAGRALADGRVHVVVEGDSLTELAEQYEITVDRIRELNELDGDTIRLGQELRVDPEPVIRYRTIPGDTLGCIASRFHVPLARVLEDNPHVSSRHLEAGQRLRLRGAVDPRAEVDVRTSYTVASGDTLTAIAERFGVTVGELEGANEGVDPEHLEVGSQLDVPGVGRVVHTVARGENLTRIAGLYSINVARLRAENPGVRPSRLRVGQELDVPSSGRRSESVGAPNCGFVRGSVPVGTHRFYVLRNPERSFATARTVRRIRRAFDRYGRRFRRGPHVRVHDLSLEGGGPIDDHRSHQSGRDVDITYFQRGGCGPEGCPLERLDPEDLDVRRQWALMHEWLRRDEVEAIYVDYALQAPLYREARRRGATRAQLREWFQFPRGRRDRDGLVRHFPNHRNHLHVRFACESGERGCR